MCNTKWRSVEWESAANYTRGFRTATNSAFGRWGKAALGGPEQADGSQLCCHRGVRGGDQEAVLAGVGEVEARVRRGHDELGAGHGEEGHGATRIPSAEGQHITNRTAQYLHQITEGVHEHSFCRRTECLMALTSIGWIDNGGSTLAPISESSTSLGR